MQDCSKCKYSDVDYIYDEETEEEYPLYMCEKKHDTSLDFECPDYKEYKPRKSRERDTECDKCNLLNECKQDGSVLDCTSYTDTRQHYMRGILTCKKHN